jgi:ABC-type molybdate transport system permease subunit
MRKNEGVNSRFPDFAGYLLLVFLAKTSPMYTFLGKELDNSIYFTLYWLSKVADSIKQTRFPITYERTKVSIKIYTMLSNRGLVDIKK